MSPADTFLDTIPEEQSLESSSRRDTHDLPPREGGLGALGNSYSATSNSYGAKKKKGCQYPESVSSSRIATIDINDDQGPTGQEKRGKNLSKPASSCHPIRLILLGVLVLAVIGVSVFLIWKYVVSDEEESPKEKTAPPTLVPSLQFTFSPNGMLVGPTTPTISPAGMSKIDTVLLGVSSEEDFLDPTTPQGKCRDWIAEKDTLDFRSSLPSEAEVLQRYIFCVVYYSTGGDEWVLDDKDNPLMDPDGHVCSWNQVGCLKNETTIVALYLNDRNLQGTIPSELVHLSSLEYVHLGENQLKGTIPQGLLELDHLVFIDLSSNKLTGTIPSTATSPTTPSEYSPLETLYLDDNRLEGKVPFFDSLIKLRVQRNLFTGFDFGYTTLQSLTSWKMYNNSIRGPLPTNWDAPNLKYVDLSMNEWTGSIPESLWNLPLLENLVLHNGSLTGTLPESTVSTTWQHLWLHDNLLGGTIPPTFGSDWTNVTEISLSGNRFEGSIPPNFGWNWTNLTEIMLHDNALLTGEISGEQCDRWPRMTILEADCNRQNLTCQCCTVCHP